MRLSLAPILVAAIVIGAFVYLLFQVDTCEVGPQGCSLSIGGFTLGR